MLSRPAVSNAAPTVYYSEYTKNRFYIQPPNKNYVDSDGIVHEVTRTIVATNIFGGPISDRATVVVRCGGGVSVQVTKLSATAVVTCWECLAR